METAQLSTWKLWQAKAHLDNGKFLFSSFLKLDLSYTVCASQMHLCITNSSRPAQLNKALSGSCMALSLVNISVSLNYADCHLHLIHSCLLSIFYLPICLVSLSLCFNIFFSFPCNILYIHTPIYYIHTQICLFIFIHHESPQHLSGSVSGVTTSSYIYRGPWW